MNPRDPRTLADELSAAYAARRTDLSGTLTESNPISAGETWTAAVEGIALPVLTLKIRG